METCSLWRFRPPEGFDRNTSLHNLGCDSGETPLCLIRTYPFSAGNPVENEYRVKLAGRRLYV